MDQELTFSIIILFQENWSTDLFQLVDANSVLKTKVDVRRQLNG